MIKVAGDEDDDRTGSEGVRITMEERGRETMEQVVRFT